MNLFSNTSDIHCNCVQCANTVVVLFCLTRWIWLVLLINPMSSTLLRTLRCKTKKAAHLYYFSLEIGYVVVK